jgi:16S rRNA (guanine966-N2)-methyltransferase
MRIIAGKYKSRLINSPKGVEVRPTSDRVKESMFGILGTFVIDKNVLDLFSGTGNLGIEALSRGAKTCVFIDSNPRCIAAIKENLGSLGIKEEAQVILKDAFRYIKEANENGIFFDVIFLDPPYYRDSIKKSLILLDDYNIITNLAISVAEHHKRDELPLSDELKNLELFRQERYGGTFLSFYRKKDYTLQFEELQGI